MATAFKENGKRGTGRRKEAIARVRLVPGKGRVVINGHPMDEYLQFRKTLQIPVMQPIVAAGLEEKYDIIVRTHGGGLAGQADAIKLGIARALSEVSETLHKQMSTEGFLHRDSRVKESKKYGRKKARKRFQFSKR